MKSIGQAITRRSFRRFAHPSRLAINAMDYSTRREMRKQSAPPMAKAGANVEHGVRQI
jgi:hypothetical protein